MKPPPHPIELVVQNGPVACVPACLEMINRLFRPRSNVSQSDIQLEMELTGDGCPNLRSEFRQLVRMKYLPRVHHNTEMSELLGLVFLATVPSLNAPGGNHRVVIDLREEHLLYDPNRGRDGAKFYEWNDLKSWSELTLVEDCTALG